MTNPLLNWLRSRALNKLLEPQKVIMAKMADLQMTTASLSDEHLKTRLQDFRGAAANGPVAPAVLADVFACLREAIIRTLGITPYDTQMLAGLALYRGFIAEMGTGEGKTLTAPLAAFAHWMLHGRQVHISTANEYLAERDARSLFPLYAFLGMAVGVSHERQSIADKRQVYGCAVVYSTHMVLAQDFLRDNLAREPAAALMPELGAVIVDEADAALIDEARLPIVLSAEAPVIKGMYEALNGIAREFVRVADEDGDGDFWVDGKDRMAVLTERGYERATKALFAAGLLAADTELYDDDHQALLMKLAFALTAQHVLFKDQHYLVQDDAIVLIDERTGRLTPGRKWDSGLQQALEAKEGVSLSPESFTMARITLQHFFKQYKAMSGMTGTALDDADELAQVYGLPVVAIPPNKPSQRVDEDDRFYRTQALKLDAVVADIQTAHAKQQPVLIGTVSVEQSLELSARLTALRLPHEVLNASNLAREADIISEAGKPGAITVSTNMAGRGVDIVLGGNRMYELRLVAEAMGLEAWAALSPGAQRVHADEVSVLVAQRADGVRQAGGLRVIGLERYESRRTDRQLRGRCARQGDPGQTCFYLSLEDNLVENFAGERIRGIFAMMAVQAGDTFESDLVKKAVDAAQREVEGRAQGARRQLMEFEGVLESQRKVIYALRTAIQTEDGLEQVIADQVGQEGKRLVNHYLAEPDFPERWDLKGLRAALKNLGVFLPESDVALVERDHDVLEAQIVSQMQMHRELRLEQVPLEQREYAQRMFSVEVLDRLWILHLGALDSLRRGIHLRQHAKADPRQVYAKEAFDKFRDLLEDLKRDQVRAALTWVAVNEPAGEGLGPEAEDAPTA